MAAITTLLGIELPVIQAPMAGAQGSALAIAVSNAGGLGSLPCALLTTQALAGELGRIRDSVRGPYNVNFFCHTQPAPDLDREERWRAALAPYYDELAVRPPAATGALRRPFDAEALDVIREFKPPVVSFHFGLPPEPMLAALRSWGAKILSSATTVDEAKWLEARGVDGIIAQGIEAGGHRGMFLTEDLTTQLGTFALVPQLVAAVGVPVIAAGGIADARGVVSALALGASGVQVGTAYLLCPEATTSDVHRAALKSDAAAHTALTNVFSGRPARGIVNRLMRDLGYMGQDVPEFPYASAAVMPLRTRAEAQGSGDFSPLWAGQNAAGCREVPAGVLTRQLAGLVPSVAHDEIGARLRQLESAENVPPPVPLRSSGVEAGAGHGSGRRRRQ